MNRIINNEAFRDIMEQLPDAIIITDNAGIIQASNERVFSVYGYKPEELEGKEIEILIPSNFRKVHKEHINNYFKNPEVRKMGSHRKVLGLKKDGTEFEVDIALSPVEVGEKLYSISSSRDISDKRQSEKVLREQNKNLEIINESLEKFGYTISHDLKAPLNKIEALTNILLEEIKEGKPPEELEDIGRYIRESISSMGKLISETLDHAKAGKEVSQSEEDIKLGEVFDEIGKLINVPGNFKINVNCNFNYLPGKKAELLQVFLNLFTNAIKYNDKPEGNISISCEDLGEAYKFYFSDNGSGIPEEKLESIFNLFEKESSGEQSKESHGIGLFTVRHIIEKRKGTINVNSKVGEGTTFDFTWPKTV